MGVSDESMFFVFLVLVFSVLGFGFGLGVSDESIFYLFFCFVFFLVLIFSVLVLVWGSLMSQFFWCFRFGFFRLWFWFWFGGL